MSTNPGLPSRFRIGQSYREVREVLDRWPGEDYLYLKVRADDGGIYILRRQEEAAGWELVVYSDQGRPETRLSGD